jgi:hypothetical protein
VPGIFWATTSTVTINVSLAAYIAGLLGISTAMAATLLTGGTIAMVGLIGYWSYFPLWRDRIRRKILHDIDTTIFAALRDWCDEVVNKMNEQR